jgi:hypothetical protein
MRKIFTILFFALISLNNINAATFSSVASGTWITPATWAVTGTDADGIPDLDDDVTINGGHSITLIGTSTCKSITTNASGTLVGNGKLINIYGNFTNNGSVTGTLPIRFFGSGIFSSSTLYTNPGNWQFFGTGTTYTIAAGTAINKINNFDLNNSVILTNLGNVQITGSINFWNTSQWINSTNSNLQIGRSFGGNTSGGLNASATGNSVTYNSSAAAIDVYSTTYYNLTFTGGSFGKTVKSNLIVLNNFTLSSLAFNLNNFNLTVGGNWNNTANFTILNQGTITFNGSGTQTISRTTANEQINTMVLSGSGSVSLNRTLFVSQSLTINSGTLDVSASNIPLFLQGSFTNNGTLNCRQGTVTFNGTSNQSISGSSNTQFYNLTLSNPAGLAVNSAQSLTNILTNSGGTFNSNGNFTLISNASTTARIASVTGTGAFSGSMTIQKHISARAANYHDLSSPVSNSTIMDWDDDLFMSGIGTDDGTPGPAGVDGTASGDNSVFDWQESLGDYTAVTGSSTPLVAGKAYEIFIGDNLTSWAARTIDTKGTPNFGSKTVNLSFTGSSAYAGSHLVGNPYASAVNYSACTKTNITGNVLILDNTGNYTDYGSSPVIPPHQGFWITASSAGSLVFLENSKSTSMTTSFFRTTPNYGIKLMFSSPILPFYNENTINFNDNSNLGYDRDLDALYMRSPNKTAPAIYMLTNTDAKLITNNINTLEDEITIPLAMYTPKEGVYYIEPNVLGTNNYNYVWIENTKTGKKYELNYSITVLGKENNTNTDYVLKLSKKSSESDVNQAIFYNDMIVFGSENTVNLKSINSTHYLSKVAIYDISGKLMFEENNMIVETGHTNKVDISNLSSGVYIVNVTDFLGHVKTQKIIR